MLKKLKKYISALLAAAMVTTFTPVGSFAADDTGHAASVTVNGSTSYVDNLAEAFTTENNGAVITLLRDAAVNNYDDRIKINASGCNFTLDLDGHAIGGMQSEILILENGALTVRDSSGGGAVKGTLELDGSSGYNDLTLEGGSYTKVYLYSATSLTVTGENVRIDNLNKNRYDSCAVKLSAGYYKSITYGKSCESLLAEPVGDKYYAFHDGSGKPIPASATSLKNVTVRVCDHSNSDALKYERVDDSTHTKNCLACGCKGEAEAHQNNGGDFCSVCSEVKVTLNNTTSYLSNLGDAFASTYSGAEIMLLRDVSVSSRIEIDAQNCNFTLDLAGHAISGSGTVLSLKNGALTVRDSGSGGKVNGTIESYYSGANSLTLESGSYKGVSISAGSLTVTSESVRADSLTIYGGNTKLSAGYYGSISCGAGCKKLLADSEGKYYAFHDADGKPIPVYDSTNELNNVTVKECGHTNSDALKYERVNDSSHQMTCLACGYKGEEEAHQNDGNGVCTLCSEVKVTLNGTTSYLSSLAEAFTEQYSGAEITLLGNVISGNAIDVTSGTFALDLAGYTVKFSSGVNNWLMVGGSANITVRDSGKTGRMENDKGGAAIYLAWSNNNPAVTLEGGSFSGISVIGGMLKVDSGSVNIDVLNTLQNNTKLSAGTYGKITIPARGDEVSLSDILLNYGQNVDSHYAFYGSDGRLVSAAESAQSIEVSNVTVKECTHEGSNVQKYERLNDQQHKLTCLACGYSKEEAHTAGADGQCSCVSVKIELNGTEKYASSLSEALTAENSGAVITLLRDTQGGEFEFEASSPSFTLDLNGHTVFLGLMVRGAGLTVRDSAGNGTVESLGCGNGNLTVEGGRFGSANAEIAAILYNCTAVLNDGYFSAKAAGLYIEGGDVTINGGSFNATEKIPNEYPWPTPQGDGLYFIDGTLKLRDGEFSGMNSAVTVLEDDESTAVLSDLLGHTDTERYAYYNGDTPITEGLDGKTLTGTVTVKKCGHENAEYMYSENDTHSYSCKACGGSGTGDCVYGDYTPGETDHTRVCESCGNEKTEEHTTKKPENAATCEKKAVCDICGGEYGELAAHILEKTEATEPTCTEDGNVEYWTCSVCKKIFSDTNGTTEIAAESTVIGKLGHNYENGKCTVCGAVDADHTHTGGTATCQKKAVCTICGKEYGELAGHSWGDGEVTKPATCTEKGVKTYTCTVEDCGETKAEDIAMLPHTEEIIPAVAATCTTAGSTAGIKCSVCETVLTAPEIIPALGHKYGTDWKSDVLNHWHECTVCGDKIDTAAHTEDSGTVTVKPTTESTGTRVYACKECGAMIRDEVIPALDPSHEHEYAATWKYNKNEHWHECICGETSEMSLHVWDSGMPVTAPTCTETGVVTYTCTVCGITKTETVNALGHSFTNYIYNNDATCTEDGTETAACDRCPETATRTAVGSKKGHTEDSGTVTKQPTETEAGVKTFKCTVCGIELRTETIPPIPAEHTHVYGTAWIYDTTSHWHECECGEKADTASHISDGGTVTKQPTAAETGVKTFSCAVCGYVMNTEIIPSAGTPSTPVTPPSVPSIPSTATSAAAAQTPSKEPFIQGDNGKTGWEAISDTILGTPDGGRVTVNMNSTTKLPKNIISQIQGQDIDLVLDMGGGFVWTVNGLNVTKAKTVDMRVRKLSKIPKSAVDEYFGGIKTIQLDLKHNGDFGFIAELTVDLGSRYDGMYANSYCYKSRTFEFGDSAEIVDGQARLRFSHASSWLITIENSPAIEDVSSAAGVHSDAVPINSANHSNRTADIIFCEAEKLRVCRERRRYRVLKK